jgi:Thioredoxin-like
VLFGACVIACLSAMSAAQAGASAAPNHPDAPAIEWYRGDVAGAFQLAAREHKPVFLYWGAKCPPCLQLKSSVFSRSDFIAKTRQFVAVHLDGDDPDAQKWGETFHVLGYPTVVILRPDQREVTRLSGGMDLSLCADLPDIAQSDITPIADVLATLRANPAPLSHAACQRPAYYGGDLADISAEERGHKAAALAWFERANRESRGTATRFQWGDRYLSALLRLAPTDRQKIRHVAEAVIANLDGPNRIFARSRMHLERLEGHLHQWDAGHQYDADLREIRKRMQDLCARLPSADAGLASCRNFLSGAA